MHFATLCCWALTAVAQTSAPSMSTAVSLQSELRALSLDPEESYHVRDLRLRRGDVDIFLNEGVVTFAKPIAGHRIAAVFSAIGSEGGDGEVIVIPSQPSERASLAAATGHANLDEHFTSAIIFFSDQTLRDVQDEIAKHQLSRAPEVGAQVAAQYNPVLQHTGDQVQTALLRQLLDQHSPENGIFYCTIMGRELGPFDFLFDPSSEEPVVFGRVEQTVEQTEEGSHFRIWTSYRSRGSPVNNEAQRPPITDYHLDVTLAADLAMTATARFEYTAGAVNGRVIPLSLSPHLRVTSALVDGQTAEVLQSPGAETTVDTGAEFLIVTSARLTAGQHYSVAVNYGGTVIRRVSGDSYFVADRTVWYPYATPMLTNFDMLFHFPDRFRLVATGESMEEQPAPNHTTLVHRRTAVPEQFAGFNLGQYTAASGEAGSYRLDVYADRSSSAGMNDIPQEASRILSSYTERWGKLPIHSLSVTPIPGYFGQGFPGLIYLSTIAYMPEAERPAAVRDARGEVFSKLLLPHEIAHQWWGNLVAPANYRASWLPEAMANDSALKFLGQQDGPAAIDIMLHQFREDLLERRKGEPVESAGPIDFGPRLWDTAGQTVWHTILYEKGAWVLHMLEQRLGANGFLAMQRQLIAQYPGKAITNDKLRLLASRFVPAGQPDRTLKKFFETWIDGTGIPHMHLKRSPGENIVTVKGVDEEFTADVPLRCKTQTGHEVTRWLSVVSGDNVLRSNGGTSVCQLPRPSDFLYQPD